MPCRQILGSVLFFIAYLRVVWKICSKPYFSCKPVTIVRFLARRTRHDSLESYAQISLSRNIGVFEKKDGDVKKIL